MPDESTPEGFTWFSPGRGVWPRLVTFSRRPTRAIGAAVGRAWGAGYWIRGRPYVRKTILTGLRVSSAVFVATGYLALATTPSYPLIVILIPLILFLLAPHGRAA